MARKKWTQKSEITDQDLYSREKKKWQIALRRYVIEKKPSPAYAHYFGLDIPSFQAWINIQLPSNLSLNDFGQHWQLTHVVPVSYFNLLLDEEKKLCWNFLNIRVSLLENDEEAATWIDFHRAKAFFSLIYTETKLPVAKALLEKLVQMESPISAINPAITNFLDSTKSHILQIADLTPLELELYNNGRSFSQVSSEMNLLKKLQ